MIYAMYIIQCLMFGYAIAINQVWFKFYSEREISIKLILAAQIIFFLRNEKI